ncbi:MAG: hypothetical protein GY940_31220 [bacterium]|nr:hypothetical protein [bacterium]
MKKLNRFLPLPVILAALFVLFLAPAAARESKKSEEEPEAETTPVIEPNPLLKGIGYVRVRCKFNGTAYFQGFRHPRDEKKIEFNLTEVETQLKDAGIPMDKTHIRALYDHTESLLKKAGVRPLEIRPASRGHASLVPYVNLNVDVEVATEESYIVLVYLTVSKWMSAWSGERSVQAPVIVWWQKKVLVVPPSELTSKLDEAAIQLADEFQAHFAVSNPPPPGQETTEKNTANTAPTGTAESAKLKNK